jgi:membrane-associated protease RseP (regulator of RpoE activity)
MDIAIRVSIIVFLFYLGVYLHEFAHLDSTRNNGIKVREFMIGRGGPRVSFTPKTGKYAGICFSVHYLTFWLWAGVDADDKLFELPWKEKALLFCAGPFANIHFGCLLYILLFASTIYPSLQAHDISGWGIEEWILYFYYLTLSSPYLWGSLLTMFVLWFFRRPISAYLAPILGLVIVAYIFRSLYHVGVVSYFSDVIGPVGFVASMPEMASTMWTAVEWSATISLGFAAINLLPIYLFDGGYLFLPVVEKIFPRLVPLYKATGHMILFALLALIIAKDIIAFFGYCWFFAISLATAIYYFWKKVIRK